MTRHFVALSALILIASPLLGDTTHTVAAGETLYAIARQYGVDVEKLMADNGITDEDVRRVRPGIRLLIRDAAPPTTEYVVQKGDTFWSISRRYGLTVAELSALNPGVDSARVREGARLRVPVVQHGTGQPAPTADPHLDTQGAAQAAAGASQQQAGAAQQTGRVVQATSTAATSSALPAPVALPPARGAEADLWPHPGPRTQVKDRNFQHISIAASVGDPVKAVASGSVTWASPFSTYGIVVIILTGSVGQERYQFWYAGMDDVYVRPGDWVTKGTTLGRVAATGIDAKPRVVFGVYRGTTPVDHTGMVWR
jgi:murein DD-endopeptidase MepM/ murein hydrolase activator NlpD